MTTKLRRDIMYSRIVAEGASVVVGSAVGAVSGFYTKKLLRHTSAPELAVEVTTAIAAGLGHYIANQITDTTISIIMLDPIGAAVGVGSSVTEAIAFAALCYTWNDQKSQPGRNEAKRFHDPQINHSIYVLDSPTRDPSLAISYTPLLAAN
jgi:hypothetical protein